MQHFFLVLFLPRWHFFLISEKKFRNSPQFLPIFSFQKAPNWFFYDNLLVMGWVGKSRVWVRFGFVIFFGFGSEKSFNSKKPQKDDPKDWIITYEKYNNLSSICKVNDFIWFEKGWSDKTANATAGPSNSEFNQVRFKIWVFHFWQAKKML